MPRRPRERPEQDRRTRALEMVCVAVVLLAVAALFVWFLFHHGGGVLNQG